VAGSSLTIRNATAADGEFLADMLVAAVNWSPEWRGYAAADASDPQSDTMVKDLFYPASLPQSRRK
jgi:hypothetical protein